MKDYVEEMRESVRQVMNDFGIDAKEETVDNTSRELGWHLAAVPENYGGLGLGISVMCAMQYEMGRVLSKSTHLSQQIALMAICKAPLQIIQECIGAIDSGVKIAAPLSESSLVLQDGTLMGRIRSVPSADDTQYMVFWTSSGDYVGVIDLDHRDIRLKQLSTWDPSRRLYDVIFESVSVEHVKCIAQTGEAEKLIRNVLAIRNFLFASDSLGGSSAILEVTVEYLLSRNQFGRPLAMFQALKHRCSDLKTMLEAAEAFLNQQCVRFDESVGIEEMLSISRRVKYFACNVYSCITEEAMQLHGGIAMAIEHPCHLYLKRAMLNEQLSEGEKECLNSIGSDVISQLVRS